MRKYTLNENYFEDINTEEKAYWLGFLHAEAGVSVNKKGNQLIVSLSQGDGQHLFKLAAALQTNAPIRNYEYLKKNGKLNKYTKFCLTYSGKLAETLTKLGVKPKKSHTLLPAQLDESLMRHYWRGLFDGDGHIMQTRTWWKTGLCGSKPCVEGFKKWANHVSGTKANVQPDHSVYSFTIQGVGAPQALITEMYKDNTVSLDRKQKIAEVLMAMPIQRHWYKIIKTFNL